ncbi:MAG: hypothetical protein IPG74_13350 [Flavobacteriales bacterium]|nr:hypothetical protein [Flavobacteriales bacterium]
MRTYRGAFARWVRILTIKATRRKCAVLKHRDHGREHALMVRIVTIERA